MSTDPNKDAASEAVKDTAHRLYTEHGGSLKRQALRIVPSSHPSDADDAVQGAFTRIIRHLKNGNSINSPKTFLSKVLHSVVYSMFYRKTPIPEIDSTPDMDQFQADEYTSPEHRVMAHQRREAFNSAIAQIPERYKLSFILRRVYGVSCKEIGEKLGVSESVVQNRAAKGCKHLVAYCKEHNIVLEDYDDMP